MKYGLTDKELGVIQVVLERFEKQRLPDLLKLRDKIDAGERMSEIDVSILETALNEAKGSIEFADKHPEYQTLIAEVNHLYKHIADKALENESQANT
ncbi:hypothetical protein NBRC116583_12620 [Arenicella sp. 4NH20-0111]|uniref:hypothetical protein n=1 Tax=Arenicella sp. 4NH20-0111 TaxID=3127648 RepID=UPI0031074BFD